VDTEQRPAGRELQDLKRNPSRTPLDAGCTWYKRSKFYYAQNP